VDECKHGTDPAWCAICRNLDVPVSGTGPGQPWGGETKQDVLDDICRLLRIPAQPVGVGSSLPSGVFMALKSRFDLAGHSMPEIAEAAALRAGLRWDAECDSRGTLSGGGSTVTLVGLQRVREALKLLV
jgi:hypothetical protein